MADVQSNINVNIDTSDALASLKLLQRQISAFHTQMSKSGAAASAVSANQAQNLMNSINATGKFQASMRSVKSSTESFTDALEKNKLTSREYFRYTGAATKTFGRLFKSEFETINKVARERVKDIQTQYIKLGRGANGALQAIAVRPLALDMKNLGTQTAMAAQKQQLLNQLLKQGSTNLLNFGKNTQWAGRQLMVGFTVPLAMLGTAAAKTFMAMEEQAIRFKRVYGDMFTTKEQTNEMIDQIQTLAREYTKYGVAVEETMKMAADAAAMGKVGSELTAQVAQATRLAVLGGVEQAQALETTISITNAFGVAAEDLTKKIDFLNAVENQTVVSIEDLTVAIPKAGPVVQQLGGDVEDLAFFLTAMKEGGINASEGANALKSGLASLINPSEKASKFLAGLGINIKGIVEANKGDVKSTVIDFSKALDTLDPLNRARAIEQLFGKFQFSRLSTLFQNVTAEGTQASRVLELTKNTTEELAILSERELGKIEETTTYKFKKAIEDLKVTLAPVGEQFLKALTPIVEFAAKILDKFNDLGDGSKRFITIMTVALGAIGPIALMSFGLLANGLANIIKLFATLRGGFQKAGSSTQVLGQQTDYLTQQQLEASAVAASLDQVHQKLKQTFTSEASAVGALALAYQRAMAAQRAFGLPAGVRPPGKPMGKFAEGGIISGPGGPKSDSIPIMASNGEAIIAADVVDKYPGLVNGLISGNIPGYKNSGIATKPGGSVNFRGQTFTSTQATAPKITGLITEAQKLAGVVDNIDDIILEALTRVAKTGKVTLGKFNAEMKALTDGAVSFRGGKLSGMASRTGAIQGGYSGNAGIVAAHGSAPVALTSQQAQSIGQQILSRVPGNATGTALLDAKSAGLRSNLTFPMPAAFNKGEMTGAEGAQFIGRNRTRFTSMIAEQHGMDPNDPGLLDFGKRVGMALKKVGKTAVDDSMFYEIIKKELEVSLNSAAESTRKAGQALQKSASSYGTAQVITPTGRAKGDRMNMPRAAAGIAIPGYDGKTLAGESYRSQDISKGNKSSDKFIVKAIRQRIRKIFFDLESGVKEELKIASPSKKMKKAGNDAGAGLVQGAREYVDDAKVVGQQIGSASTQAMAAASRTALYGTGPIDASQKSLRRHLQKEQKKSALGKNAAYPASVISSAASDSSKKQTVGSRMSAYSQKLRDRRAERKESGKGMGAGGKMMAASGVMMAASMIPGQVGNAAQKLMMPMMALSMVMPLLASKVGIAAVAIGAIVGTIYMFNESIKKARTEGIELAKSMSMGAEKIKALSMVTGKVSATEAARRKRENIVSGSSEGQRRSGQTILDSDFGKTIMSDIDKQAKAGIDTQAIGKNISANLAQAVMQGVISTDQAKSIASALGEQLGDYTIPAEITGNLVQLLGPNGENLFNDPLSVALKVKADSMDNVVQSFEQALAGADSAATQKSLDWWKKAIDHIVAGAGGSMPFAQNALASRNTKLDAAAVQMGVEAVQLNQANIDSLNKQYAIKIQNAKTDKEALALEDERKKKVDALNQANKTTLTEVRTLSKGLSGDQFTKAINTSVDLAYKDSSDAVKTFVGQAKDQLGQLSDSPFKTNLQLGFASKDLSASTIIRLLQAGTEDKYLEGRFNLLVEEQGFANADTMFQLLSKTGAKAPEISVLLNYVNQNKESFDTDLEAVQALSRFKDQYGITLNLKTNGVKQVQVATAALAAIAPLPEKLDFALITRLAGENPAVFAGVKQDWAALSEGKDTISKNLVVNYLVGKGDPNVIAAANNEFKGNGLTPSGATAAYIAKGYVNPVPTRIPDPVDTGGKTGPDASALDDLVKRLRDVRNNTIKVTQGFNASSKALNKLFGGNKTLKIFSGIENDMRRLGAGEDLIELVVGMDPKEYEKQKNKLFKFDKGEIVGIKDTARSIGDALQSVKLGEFVSEQEKMVKQIASQTTALNRIKAAGVEGSVALEAVADATFAAAIANKKLTDKDIKKIVNAWKESTKAKKEYIALEALQAEESELDANVDLLKRMTAVMGEFTQEQVDTIMQSERLKTALVNLASVKPGSEGYKRFLDVLKKALNKEKVQLEIDLVSIEGMQKVFDRGFSNAIEKADVAEKKLQLKFDMDTEGLQKTIDLAQDKIDAAQEDIDDKEAALRAIEKQEEKINEKYDERIKALDEVEKANAAISQQQKGQLTLAEALTSGDIAAAAKAAQEMRAQQAADAVTKEKEALEKSKQNELNRVTQDGKTRKQLEKEIRDLEDKIFDLEEKDIEPAQKAIRELSIPLREAVRELDKFRRYWEGLQNKIDDARTTSQKFLDEMKLAESVVDTLASRYRNEKSNIITSAGTLVPGGANPGGSAPGETVNTTTLEGILKASGMDNPSGTNTGGTTGGSTGGTTGGSTGGATGGSKTNTVPNDAFANNAMLHREDLDRIAQDAAKNLMLFNQNMNVREVTKNAGSTPGMHLDSLYKQQNAAVVQNAMKPTAGMIAQEKAAAAGAAKLAAANKAQQETTLKKFGGNQIAASQFGNWPVKRAMGGIIPKRFALGGFAKGTDTVPAMLTPGEFIMSKYAVDSYGVDNMRKINNGDSIGGTVYNNTYTLTVNAKTDANPNDIAQAVMSTIKRVDDRRIRGVALNGR